LATAGPAGRPRPIPQSLLTRASSLAAKWKIYGPSEPQTADYSDIAPRSGGSAYDALVDDATRVTRIKANAVLAAFGMPPLAMPVGFETDQPTSSGAIRSGTAQGTPEDQKRRRDPNLILVEDRSQGTKPAVSPRTAVAVDLPGWPNTYLDSEFSPMVENFIKYAQQEGATLKFTSGYRDQAKQTDMVNNGIGITPAKQSLHSAGLAVDVLLPADLAGKEWQTILSAAARAGLKWGGDFNDPVHFYFDPIPGQDRGELITNFAEQVRRLQMNR